MPLLHEELWVRRVLDRIMGWPEEEEGECGNGRHISAKSNPPQSECINSGGATGSTTPTIGTDSALLEESYY